MLSPLMETREGARISSRCIGIKSVAIMKHSVAHLIHTLALALLLSALSAFGGTPEESRAIVIAAIPRLPDVSSRNLYLLQLLSEGRPMEEAATLKSSDPDTVNTYEALTPDARKKLALNFARKIKDPRALEELAQELPKDATGSAELTPEAARKAISDALGKAADVTAPNLVFLRGLADGKSWDDASEGKRADPDTLATYASLSPEDRKKLALNFANKIKDPPSLARLARELTESAAPHADSGKAEPFPPSDR